MCNQYACHVYIDWGLCFSTMELFKVYFFLWFQFSTAYEFRYCRFYHVKCCVHGLYVQSSGNWCKNTLFTQLFLNAPRNYYELFISCALMAMTENLKNETCFVQTFNAFKSKCVRTCERFKQNAKRLKWMIIHTKRRIRKKDNNRLAAQLKITCSYCY